jgi:hypothetical protein
MPVPTNPSDELEFFYRSESQGRRDAGRGVYRPQDSLDPRAYDCGYKQALRECPPVRRLPSLDPLRPFRLP